MKKAIVTALIGAIVFAVVKITLVPVIEDFYTEWKGIRAEVSAISGTAEGENTKPLPERLEDAQKELESARAEIRRLADAVVKLNETIRALQGLAPGGQFQDPAE